MDPNGTRVPITNQTQQPVSDIVPGTPVQTMQAEQAPQQNVDSGPQIGNVRGGHHFFSKKTGLILIVVLVLLAAGGAGLYFYFTQSNSSDAAVAPPPAQKATSPAPATDDQLDSDMKNVDADLGSAGSDLSGADQGITYQQPDLSQ